MAILASVTVKAEDLAYTTNNDGTLTITGFASDFTQQDNYTLVIPDEINGKAVTAISAGAFKGKTNFTSLTIGRNVKSIGNKAFESCTALTGVVIPNTVTFIGEDVFYNCTGMTEASFEDGYALDYIPMWMFDNTAISTITIPPSVKDIQQGAFKNCSKLTSIVIPSNVTTLGKEAFMNCPLLTEVTIPSTITSMDASVFYSCGIETATVACETIGAGAFDGCNKLTTLNLMDGVKTIKKEAFYGCSKLTTVSIPSSVTTMEESAFHSCLLLATVNFADGIKLETIPDYAFYKSGLTSIAIPVSVKTIGNYAFQECNKLTNVIFPENTQVTTINDRAFSSCALLPSFTMPNTLTTLGTYVFSDCPKLTTVAFSNQLTAIPSGTFYHCTSLNGVTIPENITSLGTKAFEHCTSLTSIIVPKSITSIGEDVFWECTNMTEASFEEGFSLDYIGPYMFDDTHISTIIIPPSVKTIKEGAFKKCHYLTHIEIPATVHTINGEAFMSCELLESITLPSSIGYMGNNLFNGDNSLQFIDVSQCVNVYDLYKNISSLRNGIFYGVPTSTKIIMPPYAQATLGDNDEVATLEFDLEQVDGYYLINSAADWDKFVVYSRANPEVNGRLTKDINLDGHDGKLGVGNDFSNNIPYQGTFDGQYFTISVNYQANKDYTGGLFSWVKNATIKQLTVSGAIETSHHYTGGFIGGIVTALTMNDCESRVIMTINGSTSNTLCIGGFIGHSGDRNAVKLTDCLFSGTINDNTNKGYVAPFTAYTSSSYNAVYTNCLNNGTFNTNPSSTIVLWDGSKATFSNCYYKAGNYSSDYVYGTSVSAYQLAQGEIAFNLQGDRTEQHWGQVIGTDPAPVLTNDPNKWVYKINEYKYSNNPNDSGILTGISHAEQSSMAEGQNDEWFTPEGQKLNGRPTAKGIYIRNGRKVILK